MKKQILFCIGLVTLQCILLVGMQYYLNASLSAPLDDSFIHYQYAKQIALGDYFRYQPQQPISSGATSFLYVHTLALGHLIGFQGDYLILWSFLLAFVCECFVFYLIIEIAKHLGFYTAGYFAVAAIWLSGNLAWSFWSGMEIVLLTALLLWVILEFIRQDFIWCRALIPLSILALCRPEGVIFGFCLIGIRLLYFGIKIEFDRQSIKIFFACILYTLCLFGPSLFFYMMTGQSGTNTLQAKSLFYHPAMTFSQAFQTWIHNFYSLLLFLMGDPTITPNVGDYLLPGTLLFALFGIFALSYHSGPGRYYEATATIVPLTVVFLAIASLEVWSLHNFRYLSPFIPLLLLMAVIGIYSAFHFWKIRSNSFPSGVLLIALLLLLSAYPSWINRYIENSATIIHKQQAMAKWTSKALPADYPLAINDAGAVAFYGDLTIFDLVGLISNEFTIPYRVGEGALYETLEHVPTEQRPHYASVFPNWFESMALTFDIFYQPVAYFPDPFNREFEKIVYQINWNYEGKENQPRDRTLRDDWIVRDYIDIADLRSEQKNHYTYSLRGNKYPEQPTPLRRNFGYHEEIDEIWPDIENEVEELIPILRRDGLLYDYDIVDAGRRITGGETFVMNNLTPLQDAYLILRTCDNSGERPRFNYRMNVLVNGIHAGHWSIEGSSWNWYESVFHIPGRLIIDETIQIEIQNQGTHHFDYYDAYYYWICQSKLDDYNQTTLKGEKNEKS